MIPMAHIHIQYYLVVVEGARHDLVTGRGGGRGGGRGSGRGRSRSVGSRGKGRGRGRVPRDISVLQIGLKALPAHPLHP
jgi:hypothetical protein